MAPLRLMNNYNSAHHRCNERRRPAPKASRSVLQSRTGKGYVGQPEVEYLTGQPFHSDVICDLLALFCLSPAATGGSTQLASSWNVYNHLASTRPDLVCTLAKDDWVHDTYVIFPLCNTSFRLTPILQRKKRRATPEIPQTRPPPPFG